MKRKLIIIGMLLIVTMGYSQKREHDDKSYFIENTSMMFIGMEHNVKSMISGITYKLTLSCVLIEYESDEIYLDDFNIPTKTKYKYITNIKDVEGLKNWRYLYPIFKHKTKSVIVIIDKKNLEGERGEDNMKLRIVENKMNKNELFLLFDY